MNKLLLPQDIVGGSFWLISVAMIGAAIFFFLERGRLANRWGTVMNLVGIIALMSSIHYFYAKNLWVLNGQAPTALRYIDWILTFPLTILTFYVMLKSVTDINRSQKDIKILAIADLQREETFLPDVPTLKEEGVDVDNSSVNFRGIMAPKGTDPKIIEFLAAKVPLMFNDKKTLKQMKKGGSPVRIMNRAEVQAMWKARKVSLTKLLAGLAP